MLDLDPGDAAVVRTHQPGDGGPVRDLHTVPLRTNDTHGLPELVRTAMRLRPTRLVIGEVRGPEALNLLIAWTTGTPGGVTTLHADDCAGALQRLALLIQLAGVANPHPLIAQAIHLIVHIDGRGTERTLKAIARLQPQGGGTYAAVPL